MMSSLNKNFNDMDLDDPRYRIKPYQQMIASSTGAIVTTFMVTPLDVVKTRLQVQQKAMLSNKCFLYCNGLMGRLCTCGHKLPDWMKNNGKLNGTLDGLIKIGRREGIFSLWSGLSPTLALAVPATMIYFVSYEQLRLYLKDTYNRSNEGAREQPPWIPMVAGAMARVSAATMVSPIELTRTKMQSERLSYSEIGQVLKTLIKNNGIKGLWMGLSPTLLRDVPFSAIYWFSYETINQTFPGAQYNFSFNLVAGATAGSVAAVITLPFDVVKTHRQIEMGTREDNDRIVNTIRRIYKQNGICGLYTGVIPRLIKIAPACAFMIATFEYGKRFFSAYNRALEHQNDTHYTEHRNREL